MATTDEFIATGRRTSSVARIRMAPGSGKIDINGRSFEDYFPTTPLQNAVLQPLQTAKAVNTYDLSITATGGGGTGRRGAAGYFSRAFASGPESARHAEGRGSVASRPAHERAEKIGTAGRAQTFP